MRPQSFISGYDVHATSSAAPEVVFALLLDGSTWPAWSPIGAYRSESSRFDEPAASRPSHDEVRVFTTGRNVSRERIVGTVPDRMMAYEMLSGSRLLQGYRGRVDLVPEGPGTRIRWRARWRSPVPGAGLLMSGYLGRFQQTMVDGLARYAEERPVTPER